ncbi:MAG: hypothetical protein RL490_212 [Pseudomonadota bacterium]
MRNFAQRRPVLAYYLLALLIVCAVMAYSVIMFIMRPETAAALGTLAQNIMDGPWYINLITIAAEVAKQPVLFGIFIFAAAPAISALVIASLGGGGGLKRLLARFNPFGPERSKTEALLLYAALFGLYALGFAVYDFVAGPGVDPFDRLRAMGGGAVFGAAIGLFLDEGGSLEELGWRGFAGPVLQDGMKSAWLAAVVLGVMHWAWHLPRELPTFLGPFDPGVWVANQTVFLVLCIALSICAMYAVNRSGGSLWPAIFIHGGSNVWSKAVGDAAAPTLGLVDLRTLLVVTIALIISVFAGRRLGRANPPLRPA